MNALITFILAINPYLSTDKASYYANGLSKYCNEPYMAAVVIQAESSFRPNAVHHNSNGTIDVGLFQINSIHGHSMDVLLRPDSSMFLGCSMLNSGTYVHSGNIERQRRYARKLARILMYGAFSSPVTKVDELKLRQVMYRSQASNITY